MPLAGGGVLEAQAGSGRTVSLWVCVFVCSRSARLPIRGAESRWSEGHLCVHSHVPGKEVYAVCLAFSSSDCSACAGGGLVMSLAGSLLVSRLAVIIEVYAYAFVAMCACVCVNESVYVRVCVCVRV